MSAPLPPMRLLQLTTNFLPGGIQRHVLDLSEGMRRRGHQVVLAGDDGDWRPADAVPLALNGVSWRGGSRLARVRTLLSCARALRREIRARRIELVHAHETAPALAALYVMVSHETDQESAAEAFGWLNSGALVGGAMGTALGGVIADSAGPFGVFMASAGLALVAAVTPLIARAAGPVDGLSVSSRVVEDDDRLCRTGAA